MLFVHHISVLAIHHPVGRYIEPGIGGLQTEMGALLDFVKGLSLGQKLGTSP